MKSKAKGGLLIIIGNPLSKGTGTGMSKTKRFTRDEDEAEDRKRGIKEGSKKDKFLDRKRGVSDKKRGK